jgi:flagellar basal body rod protein FlgG
MVDLITAQRWFEANQKVIQQEDQANSWAIENVAKTQK